MKSAIDWLVEQVNADCTNSTFIRPDLVKKAKAMDLSQKADAWDKGAVNNMRLMSGARAIGFSQYYAETYELQKSKVVEFDHLKTDGNDQYS
jgi:hypothetical protein